MEHFQFGCGHLLGNHVLISCISNALRCSRLLGQALLCRTPKYTLQRSVLRGFPQTTQPVFPMRDPPLSFNRHCFSPGQAGNMSPTLGPLTVKGGKTKVTGPGTTDANRDALDTRAHLWPLTHCPAPTDTRSPSPASGTAFRRLPRETTSAPQHGPLRPCSSFSSAFSYSQRNRDARQGSAWTPTYPVSRSLLGCAPSLPYFLPPLGHKPSSLSFRKSLPRPQAIPFSFPVTALASPCHVLGSFVPPRLNTHRRARGCRLGPPLLLSVGVTVPSYGVLCTASCE